MVSDLPRDGAPGSRHPAEGDPQVLIIAPGGRGTRTMAYPGDDGERWSGDTVLSGHGLAL
ncbi:MAG: hypothetical protein NVS4B2_22110 [Chloroflexota bacterium]